MELLPLAFGFGGPPDWALLAIVALVLLGPKRLPDAGRQIGHWVREFNKMKDELTGAAHSFRDEIESAAQPIIKPYSDSHTVSSPTVDAATARRVYDQDPADLMAPVVPELQTAGHTPAVHEDGKLLTPPPAAVATVTDAAHEKGH